MQAEKSVPVKLADGTTVLVDHLTPRTATGVVVWIRTPYGRKTLAGLAKRFTKAGAHVVVEAVRGTDGSGGHFDGIHYPPEDVADVASWLRAQPWFPGTIVSWGISAVGYAAATLALADVPEWRLAIMQDAYLSPRPVIYPGGAFAAKVMLGYLGSLDVAIRRPGASVVRSLVASVRAARRAKSVRVLAPVAGP